jgi:GNAT superfamily N-acetyltransferase
MVHTALMPQLAITERPSGVSIRRDLRPGDLGEVSALHGTVYAAEHGLDRRFEAGVARTLAEAVARGWPDRGGFWAVEHRGRFAGSLALTEEDDGAGKVRWFLLAPELRGAGLGRGMLEELLAEADRAGLHPLRLETFSALEAAGHLYRSAGFEVVDSSRFSGWGRPIVLQHYERSLA